MVSNKALSIVLVSTMLVALFGATMAMNRINGVVGLHGLTGAWEGFSTNSTYATVNLSITSQLKINFTLDRSNFGSGYINPGYSACVLSTGLTTTDAACNTFNAPDTVKGFLLENIGNEYAKVNLSNINWSLSMISGTNPGYAWQWVPEGGAAATNLTCNTSNKHADIPSPTALTNITVSNYLGEEGYPQPGKQICDVMNFSSGNNALNITFKLQIPQNAPARTIYDTWFAFATAV